MKTHGSQKAPLKYPYAFDSMREEVTPNQARLMSDEVYCVECYKVLIVKKGVYRYFFSHKPNEACEPETRHLRENRFNYGKRHPFHQSIEQLEQDDESESSSPSTEGGSQFGWLVVIVIVVIIVILLVSQ